MSRKGHFIETERSLLVAWGRGYVQVLTLNAPVQSYSGDISTTDGMGAPFHKVSKEIIEMYT